MKVAILGHVRHPICPPFAGGMEAQTWRLAEELAARGHDVTLFASGDSQNGLPDGVRLQSIVDRHYDADYPWHQYHGTEPLIRHLDAIHARAAKGLLAGDFDVIHNNGLHHSIPRFAVTHRLPMVTSLHIPPFKALLDSVTAGMAPWTRFTVTSSHQLGLWWPAAVPANASVLSNGIAANEWPFVPEGDGSAVWFGRITPNKGLHLAIEAAQRAEIPMAIYGVVEDRTYFERTVRPLLYGDVHYGGHLHGAELAKRVGRASVLLFTPLWDEPFGLVAAEAMTTGVPVACFDNGAVREVVGDCGAYAASGNTVDLADALRAALSLPRRACSARAKRLFSLSKMTDQLEILYSDAQHGAMAACA